MPALVAVGALALAGPALTDQAAAAGASSAKSPYYGRWTVDEEKPVFTARGRLYKTIDVAPCGKDFCGVSVNDCDCRTSSRGDSAMEPIPCVPRRGERGTRRTMAYSRREGNRRGQEACQYGVNGEW